MSKGLLTLACAAVAAIAGAFNPARAADLDAAHKAAICQTRSTCTIGKLYDGGKSAAGASLIVAEVHWA